MKISRARLEEILLEEIREMQQDVNASAEPIDNQNRAEELLSGFRKMLRPEEQQVEGSCGTFLRQLAALADRQEYNDPPASAHITEMMGTHTYAYHNSMPAKRDSDRELDEWLAEALEEDAAAEKKDDPMADIQAMSKDLRDAAARAKGKDPVKPSKASLAMSATKAGIGGAGLYQAVQALKSIGDMSSGAIAKVVSQMDPEMVELIKQVGEAASQLFEEQDIQEQ